MRIGWNIRLGRPLIHRLFAYSALFSFCLAGCDLPMDSGGYAPDYIKGMNIFFMPPRNAFAREDFSESLARLRAAGVNTLFLVPYYFSPDENSASISPSSRTIPDSQLVQAITMAKDGGFAVVLKPHIDLDNGNPRFKISPGDYGAWLRSYKSFALHYLDLAEKAGLTDFVIGTELDETVEHQEFREFCDSIRGASSVRLIYAASFDHFVASDIWGHVDWIGINAYFNLDNNSPPSPHVLRETWNYWLNLVSQFSGLKGKPVIITEVGYFSRSGAARNPGNWSGNPPVDPALQRDCYGALLSQAWEFESIHGIAWWQWELGGIGGPGNNDATPRGKPAEEVIRRYWLP